MTDTLEHFFTLTPDRVLEAVERAGLVTTGLCYALNSLENRVYEVELDDGSRVVAKFYRPSRWGQDAILDEHRILDALVEHEIPAVAPIRFADGDSLHATDDGIFFALFPRMGGRAPDDLGAQELEELGRVLGRMHNIMASLDLPHRPVLSPATYGLESLATILERASMPNGTRERYRDAVEGLVAVSEPLFAGRTDCVVHADFHRGNLLRRPEGWLVLDFDDSAIGPPSQDLWLVLPGRPSECREELDGFLRGYELFREFDHTSLRAIEALRGLRYVRYAAWIARRWEDPSFKRAFPDWGSERYWESQVADLYEQIRLVQASAQPYL
ncbi:MAG: serine/threonine protein kinase [Myxococcota bacterium]